MRLVFSIWIVFWWFCQTLCDNIFFKFYFTIPHLLLHLHVKESTDSHVKRSKDFLFFFNDVKSFRSRVSLGTVERLLYCDLEVIGLKHTNSLPAHGAGLPISGLCRPCNGKSLMQWATIFLKAFTWKQHADIGSYQSSIQLITTMTYKLHEVN